VTADVRTAKGRSTPGAHEATDRPTPDAGDSTNAPPHCRWGSAAGGPRGPERVRRAICGPRGGCGPGGGIHICAEHSPTCPRSGKHGGAYQRAAASTAPSCGIQWQFIAAFGRIETDHGRLQGSSLGDDGVVRPPLVGPALDGSRTGVIGKLADASGSPVRAAGPLQFIPATWQQWGHGDVQDINQAAAAAERYLCADGHDLHTGSGRRAAALSYNHADWYATDVLAIYADYIASDPAHTFPVAPGAG